jgi:hypothetical protein
MNRFHRLGTSACVMFLVCCVAALGFSPQNPAQDSPPPAVKSSDTTVAAATPVTPSKVVPGKPAIATVPLGTIDGNNWTDKTLFDPLTLIITVQPGTREGDEVLFAVQDLAADYVGRLVVHVEVPTSKSPALYLPEAWSSKKYGVVLRQHNLITHLDVMGKRLKANKPGLVWNDKDYLGSIASDDGQRVMKTEDLTENQLKKLSADSQKRWVNGQIDSESIRLWLEVVAKADMKMDLKPGPARFRVMTENNALLAFATRLPQPMLFVHGKGKDVCKLVEDDGLDEPALRVARYPDARPWLIDADSQFGQDIHKGLSEEKESGTAGVLPPDGAVSMIVFQMTDNTLDPVKGKKKHWGPHTLDPKKPLADEVDRVLEKVVKLPRPASPGSLLVTQQEATLEGPKK